MSCCEASFLTVFSQQSVMTCNTHRAQFTHTALTLAIMVPQAEIAALLAAAGKPLHGCPPDRLAQL